MGKQVTRVWWQGSETDLFVLEVNAGSNKRLPYGKKLGRLGTL
jgi:hypothetical protein